MFSPDAWRLVVRTPVERRRRGTWPTCVPAGHARSGDGAAPRFGGCWPAGPAT